jgi:transcriptional regulator with XRE-family HTH domain
MRDSVEGFPERLKALRTAIGLTQPELAEKAGCHYTSVALMESGARSPSLRLARDLAKALSVRIDDLDPHFPEPAAVRRRAILQAIAEAADVQEAVGDLEGGSGKPKRKGKK